MDPQPPDLRALAGRFFGLDVAAPGWRVVACALRPKRYNSSSRGLGRGRGQRQVVDRFGGRL